MKIAFWSPVHGQSGTTSNILATAMIAGMIEKTKIILTQTHFNFNNLEAPLVGSNSNNASSCEFFRDVGIDALIRNFKSSELNPEIINNCCISLSNTNVVLLPGTVKSNRESFEYEMDRVFLNLLRTVEKFTDLVFVDLNSGSNPLSLKIIADCDLTVVNLSQNMAFMDIYFSGDNSFLTNKVFYLLGNYDSRSRYNISNIRRRYRKYMKASNSGYIPYSTNFLDAQSDGRVISFFKENLFCGSEDENYDFILQTEKVCDKILKMTGIRINTEERME